MTARNEKLTLVFAHDENNVLGKDGKMPWHSPHDFKWFKILTRMSVIIMGRKTWESLPVKPLPDRTSYVITRQEDYVAFGAIVMNSLEAALEHAQCYYADQHLYVIGGRAVLEEAAQWATDTCITKIGVKTPVDESCVMAPELPPSELIETFKLHEGDDLRPAAAVELRRFL
jgi:dihydrofolate reductase